MQTESAQTEKTEARDEYARLAGDLVRVNERGAEALNEATPGREIHRTRFLLESRYGTIVQTDSDGSKVARFCGRRRDRRGEEKIERFFIGLSCEATTKGEAHKSELISKANKRTVNDFEATLSTAPLLKATVEEAQKAGDAVQRKIDEESYEYFPPFPTRKVETSNPASSDMAPVDQLGNLFSVIEEKIDEKMGQKVEKTEIAAYHVNGAKVITANDGSAVDYVHPMFAINVSVKTKDGNQAFGAIRGAGGGIEVLGKRHPGKTNEQVVAEFAEKIAKDAIDMDRAQGSGILGSECPVIFGPHAAAVLTHEVYGHASESDIISENRRSKSAKISLKGRIGAQVSDHPALTIIDSGERDVELGGKTFSFLWGSVPCDDHGQPPQRTVLIENGVQIGVMSSDTTLEEVLDGLKDEVAKRIRSHGLSGNTRAEKYDQPVQVRMTNTCMLPDPKGPKTLTEMAALLPKNKRGVYVHRSSGGWVNTETGEFAVEGALCYLIENGMITDKPIKNVRVSGNISKFGNEIKAIGAAGTIDDQFDGMCGKNSQWVPVTGIAPAVYVENAKLGGGSMYSFSEIQREYIKQMEERGRGLRRSVYIPQLHEVSGIEDHDHLLMVSAILPIGDDVAWVMGTKDHADYDLEGGELKDRTEVY